MIPLSYPVPHPGNSSLQPVRSRLLYSNLLSRFPFLSDRFKLGSQIDRLDWDYLGLEEELEEHVEY